MTLEEILHQYWGHKSFRPLQQQIIEAVLEGKDTLALLPTGGGKTEVAIEIIRTLDKPNQDIVK